VSQVPTALLDGLAPHHVSIAVTDMNRAIEWYTSVLGFETEFRFHVAAIPAEGAFLKSAGLRLELWCAAGVAPVPSVRRTPDEDLKTAGTKHLAFSVTGLQGRLAGLIAHEVDIAAIQRDPKQPMMVESDPLARDHPPVFALFIRDPFGTLIELLDRERLLEGNS
jgi:catechol 2,3-dioxygenase-like lactoylglutathione lyase family enzyme